MLKVSQYSKNTHNMPVLECLYWRNFIKMRLQHRCFLVNIATFLIILFLTGPFQWLLLKKTHSDGLENSNQHFKNEVNLQDSQKNTWIIHMNPWKTLYIFNQNVTVLIILNLGDEGISTPPSSPLLFSLNCSERVKAITCYFSGFSKFSLETFAPNFIFLICLSH